MAFEEARHVHVSMLGARMHYAVPRLLHEAGLLACFYTDSYAGNKPRIAQVISSLPSSLRPYVAEHWLARNEPSLPLEKVVSFEAFGLRYARAQRAARSVADVRQVYVKFAQAFNRRVINKLKSRNRVDAVWAFNGAALEIFTWAKRQGIPCILEQTIAPASVQRELLEREIGWWPGWQPGLPIVWEEDELARREAREWELADGIIGGSRFVTDGLIKCGVPRDQCHVVPYGVDTQRFTETTPERCQKFSGGRSPLRVLFAGEVGLRKGAPYLLEALARIGSTKVEARLAGRVALAPTKLTAYADVAHFLGVVPRSQMSELYEWADVFCLPSVCEGSATVTYEALMSGLPVVTTPNAGSLVSDGENGWVVPVGDVHALTEALRSYVQHPDLLVRHGQGAKRLVRELSLARYREDLAAIIETVIGRYR